MIFARRNRPDHPNLWKKKPEAGTKLLNGIARGTVDGWAQVYERPCRSQCWKPIFRVECETRRETQIGIGSFIHLTAYMVSVERLRCSHSSCTRRFLRASSSGGQEPRENIFVFTMLEVGPKYSQIYDVRFHQVFEVSEK